MQSVKILQESIGAVIILVSSNKIAQITQLYQKMAGMVRFVKAKATIVCVCTPCTHGVFDFD